MKVSNGKVFACICFEEIAITNEARRLDSREVVQFFLTSNLVLIERQTIKEKKFFLQELIIQK